MSDPNKHRVLCTDFGATLDLIGAEKSNLSVNNHAIVDIFFVLIKHYDAIQAVKGKPPIPINIVWTENCPGQYRCRQIFLNVDIAGGNHGNKTIVVHKLAEKYRFKGNWDATEKLVKERIMNNELKYDRCSNAIDCYLKLTRDIGFGTEDRAQFDTLSSNANNKHIVYTPRDVVPGMEPIKGTTKIAQVSGCLQPNIKEKWSIDSSLLPCSCPPCRSDPTNSKSCIVAELKVELKERCISQSGRKLELVQRLFHSLIIEHDLGDTNEDEDDVSNAEKGADSDSFEEEEG
mmetsp:Transcript_53785/g.62870  ORF Transcript_53785/g.62870 Transcript_53785/m.62870 type:complete len:289 (-) Transcript_53785:197-1063(-)